MALSAHDVAAELRDRLPGLPKKKLHKLLYYCQGHHLAVFDEPMFREAVMAWDMGPVVGQLWRAEDDAGPRGRRQEVPERELNTIGYVVSRYGGLTGADLEILSHGQELATPARPGSTGRRSRYVTSSAAEVRRCRNVLAAWLAGSEDRLRSAAIVDDIAAMRVMLAQ